MNQAPQSRREIGMKAVVHNHVNSIVAQQGDTSQISKQQTRLFEIVLNKSELLVCFVNLSTCVCECVWDIVCVHLSSQNF